MELITCPECGHEVSDTAETCPNCGYRLKRKKTYTVDYYTANRMSKRLKERYICGIIGAICGIFYGIYLFIKAATDPDLVVFNILMGIFMIALGIGVILFSIKHLNPDYNSDVDIYNTRVRFERIGLLIGGGSMIVAGIGLLIYMMHEFSDRSGLGELYVAPGIMILGGIGSLIYAYFKYKNDF